MAIQMRRGANTDFNASKMLPGEVAVTTDGTKKAYVAFAPNVVKELASKEDVQDLINSFTSVVDKEIAEAEQRIESKAETVLGTIPDEYEKVSAKADEAVRTKADAIVCSVSGVDIVVNDSSDDYVRNLKLYGKTTQYTTSGKNLLENTVESKTKNGITITKNADGSMTLNGTCTGWFFENLNLIDANTRTLSDGNYILSGGTDSAYLTQYVDGASVGMSKGNELSFEMKADNISNYTRLEVASSAVLNNVTIYPMIRLASITDPTYEPYTGGMAAPNPYYPQPLESKGKWGNLADFEDVAEKEYNGIYWSCKDGAVTAKGTCDSTYASPSRMVEINADITGKKGTFYVSGSKDSVAVYVSVTKGGSKVYYDSVFTLDGTETEAVVYCQVSQSKTVDTTIYPMLNEGTTALPYRPYSGQMEIESWVYGKNLLENTAVRTEKNGITLTVNQDGSVTVNGTATKTSYFGIGTITLNGEYILSGCPSGGSDATYFMYINNITPNKYPNDTGNGTTFVVDGELRDCGICIMSGTTINATFYPMIRKAEITDGTYEPYTKQSHISLVSETGLKGIPVTDASLATYTDENGQMWCADYVDCERGVLVQRIKKIVFDGVTSGKMMDLTDAENTTKPIVYAYISKQNMHHKFIDRSKAIDTHGLKPGTSAVLSLSAGREVLGLDDTDTEINVIVNAFNTLLSNEYNKGTPVTVQYILATPIETPLTASEIESYKALRSNYHTTIVMNDCDSHMDFTYNADTEIWINNKIEAKVAAVVEKLSLS